MLRTKFMIFACVSFMFVASYSSNAGGQASEATPMVATFTDNLNDNVRSDGSGPYMNGVDGVRCVIDSLNDFILQLHFNGKKSGSRRQMVFDFTDPVVESGAVDRGTFYDDAFLNVDVVGTLAVGQSRSSQAQFNTAIGLLRFNPGQYPGTSYALVTRTAETTWVITASAGTGGDVAALVQPSRKNTFVYVGNYHMPFQITAQLQ